MREIERVYTMLYKLLLISILIYTKKLYRVYKHLPNSILTYTNTIHLIPSIVLKSGESFKIVLGLGDIIIMMTSLCVISL